MHSFSALTLMMSQQIPLVTEIRETSDLGTPIVVKDPESAPARAYISVAERVWAQLQAQDDEKRSGGPRVVVE